MTIKAKIDGKIARVGELKTSQSGKQYYKFTVGIWDAKENRAEYVQAVVFGEDATQLSLLEKNAAITIFGALKLVDYTNKEGVVKQALNVTVDKFIGL